MRPTISLAIPQPCNETWAAMSPVITGRHCAACAKTVVDFTQQTDAEILAFLAKAAGARTCGRFAAGQLERPLQRAAPAAPTRWRAWLAAAAAVWAVREGATATAHAQAPAEQHQLLGALPVAKTSPEQPDPAPRQPISGPVPVQVLRGVVRDSATREGIPGVTVLLKGTLIGVSTDAAGHFELQTPAELQTGTVTLTISSIGYVTVEQRVNQSATPTALDISLSPDRRELSGELIVAGYVTARPPWPWHPRRFYSWSKYWLTRPFRSY